MVEKLEDVWFSRNLPVLLEVTRRIDRGEYSGLGVEPEDLLGGLDPKMFDRERVDPALDALERRGLILTKQFGMVGYKTVTQIDGSAYTATGLHPDGDDVVDRLGSALKQAADQSADEDEQSGLRKATRGLGEVSRGVAVGVISAALTGYLPGQ